MKKRILTVLLAVCLVVALGTVTAAAADETTVTTEDELKSAIENAQDGDVITLGNDILLEFSDEILDSANSSDLVPLIIIDTDVTIDLNGKTISWDYDSSKDYGVEGRPGSLPSTPAIFAVDGAKVTMMGNGTVSADIGNNNSFGINVLNGGTLEIRDGTYIGSMTAVQVQKGALKIYGGVFKLGTSVPSEYAKYLINVIDEVWKDHTGEIAVYGGTFEGFNPENSPEGSNTSYVPDGIVTSDTSDSFTFTPEADETTGVAEVNGIYFNSLEKAIGAALKGDTVTLVKDVNETISIAAGKSIVLDLAGKTLTSPSDSMVYGELTIEDSSNSTGTFVSDKSVSVDGGILTLESGTINIENDYGIYCLNDGTAIVNGGKIESLYAPLTGNNTTGKMNFAVNGGELTARSGPAIYMPGQGELTITGGVLKGGISLRMGQVNITGGTIYATNGDIDSPSEYYNFSGNAWFPDALYVYNGTYNFDDEECGNSLSLNITGGEFICENEQGSAVAIYDLGKVKQDSEIEISNDAVLVTNASDRGAYQVLSLADIGVNTPADGYGINENVDKVETAISGGNFSSAVDKEYLASGINAQLYSINNSNAPYSYYSTVEDAMQVAKPGDVVVNLSAVTSETMYEVKFDNNGTVATISVPDGANLTLPAHTRNGYTFGGWRYGNTVYKAGETVKVTSDMTFTAIWNAINIPDTYDIELIVGEGGEAKTNFSNASAGTTITVTATPDEGYKLDYITVDGERISGTSFKMPAHDVTVRVYFTDGTSTLPFTDVAANQWFYDAISYVYTNGMMEGDSATTFNPDGQMTRAMFWAVLGRIDGATITGANWVETARSWAMAEGVSDGTNPNDYVTREMMVTMLWRYAGEPASDESLSGYSDAANVSDWAAEAMSWALETGVIEGVTATTLQPQGTATRAQCATIFMRYDMI